MGEARDSEIHTEDALFELNEESSTMIAESVLYRAPPYNMKVSMPSKPIQEAGRLSNIIIKITYPLQFRWLYFDHSCKDNTRRNTEKQITLVYIFHT